MTAPFKTAHFILVHRVWPMEMGHLQYYLTEAIPNVKARLAYL